VFQDTDASRIHLVGMELEMLADGRGGFEITMHGGIRAQDAADAVGEGLLHMIEARPQSHLSLIRDVDVDHDGQLSAPEIATASLIRALLSPDIHMFDGDDFAPRPASDDLDVLSFGLRVHVIPCADGNCALVPPASTCFDRLLDGSETDIDCGGPVCGACPDAARCALPTDCQTGACDGGACRAATCSDGILDGFESDVDCGAACNNCGVDQACYNDSDCGSNHCSSQFGKGKCQ